MANVHVYQPQLCIIIQHSVTDVTGDRSQEHTVRARFYNHLQV